MRRFSAGGPGGWQSVGTTGRVVAVGGGLCLIAAVGLSVVVSLVSVGDRPEGAWVHPGDTSSVTSGTIDRSPVDPGSDGMGPLTVGPVDRGQVETGRGTALRDGDLTGGVPRTGGDFGSTSSKVTSTEVSATKITTSDAPAGGVTAGDPAPPVRRPLQLIPGPPSASPTPTVPPVPAASAPQPSPSSSPSTSSSPSPSLGGVIGGIVGLP